jgi:hypothetical protein
MQFPVYVTLRQEGFGQSVNINFFSNFQVICRLCDTAFKAVCLAFSEA